MAGRFKDPAQLIYDTKLVGKGKNLKGTAEGRAMSAMIDLLGRSPLTSGLAYFISRKCLPFVELVTELKKIWVKGSRTLVNSVEQIVLNLTPNIIAVTFKAPLLVATPTTLSMYEQAPTRNSNTDINNKVVQQERPFQSACTARQ